MTTASLWETSSHFLRTSRQLSGQIFVFLTCSTFDRFVGSGIPRHSLMVSFQTCSTYSTAISGDKQLWSQILDRDVKGRSLPVPYNSANFEGTSAYELECLVRRAVLLERKYNSNGKLSFRKIDNPHRLGMTWAKLIRGRWCLIATADTYRSELSVWEIQSNGETVLSSRIFLQGPVLDGVIDESLGSVNVALTVGTR